MQILNLTMYEIIPGVCASRTTDLLPQDFQEKAPKQKATKKAASPKASAKKSTAKAPKAKAAASSSAKRGEQA